MADCTGSIAARRKAIQSVKTEKIVALEKPTAMAFAADGTLYVTTIGAPGAEETAAKTGKLLKITLP